MPRLSFQWWLLAIASIVGSLCAAAVPGGTGGGGGDSRARAALAILKNECFTCHGEQKQKGGLSLLSRESILRGGDDGPVVRPGHPQDSKLAGFLQAGADSHMPPRKQLDPSQIRTIREWIKNGLAWDAATLTEEDPIRAIDLSPLPNTYHPSLALALSPNGQRLAAGRGGQLALYDLTRTNFPLVIEVQAHTDAIQSLTWSHDGHTLVSGGFRRIRFWSGDTLLAGREVSEGLSGRVTAVELTPDDRTLALADGGSGKPGYVRLLDLTSNSKLQSWRAHSDTVFDLEFSRDGTRLVTAGGDQLVKVWEVATRKELAILEGHTAQVLAAAFNDKATQVVSAGADRQLKVWDIATREKIISLGTHSAALTAVAWPGDGSALFTASDGGGVFRYTHLKSHTGEQSSASGDELRMADLTSAVQCLAVSTDGKRIAGGCQDGTIRVWDGDGKLLAELATPAPSPVAGSQPKAGGTSRRVAAVPPSGATKMSDKNGRPRTPPLLAAEIVSLSAEPVQVNLSADSPHHQVVVTARTTDGFDVDVTDAARFAVSRGAPLRMDEGGDIRALGAGSGVVTARVGSKEIRIPVNVRGDAALTPPVPSFVRDILPALNQAGCSAGSCHAKPDGQNGFKLSVFSYDPKADYAEIVNEAHGRRIFPAAPDESLLLLKPLTRTSHEGGQRFAPGSETHQLLSRWIHSGMSYSLTNEPVVERVTAFPKERRYRKGATQRLLVLARYSDGSMRDVTRLALYDSNDKEMARVDEQGRITIGQLTGQGVVVARYMGFVGDAQIMVPADKVFPVERYAGLRTNNFIDTQAYAQFQRLGLLPSDPCTDLEFLRRATLDTVGLLPTPDEIRAFQKDPSPDKRRRLIDRLLENPAYADFWANKWADLLRPNPDRVGVKSVFLLDQWLRERFRANQPYDQFVREILLAEGSNQRVGPAVIYRDRREPAELTTMFSQLFLGTRLECAKCHHHPNEKWSQEDFYRLAAYFGPLKQKGAGLSPPISAGTETFFFAPGGTVKHPITGAVMTPRPPDGAERGPEPGDPRRQLADWLTAPGNPFFARAAVNRVWASFYGRGLVQPVDDFRSSNPCVNPALLDGLAADFSSHGYDLKHLIRTILESQTYQLSSTPNDTNLADTRNFSRSYRRRLPAEVMDDAVSDATGVPDVFAAMPIGGRATQAWSYRIQSHFLDAFGRPNSSSDCPCERDTQLSVAQTLHLMNSRTLQAKFINPSGRLQRLARSSAAADDVVEELYLATLGRPPTAAELATAVEAFLSPGATRKAATEDVFWALINSPEFMFNH